MLTSNYIESRLSKFLSISELSDKYLQSENIETKLKKRKSKIFLLISNKRKQYLMNSVNINLNLNNTANFIKVFNLIKNKDEKINLINYLFTKNITNAKIILSKYEKSLNLDIDYKFLSTSNFILDSIEKSDEIIELIVKKKENINYLLKIISLMDNETIEYDYNYIMITANLLTVNKNINKIIKKGIDHDKLIQLIIKNETIFSYTYLFYVYAFLYYCDIQQMEKFESILESLFWILCNKNNNDISMLYEDIYDVLLIFAKVPKFGQTFFDSYNLIFGNGEFSENDSLIEQKLSIISNLFKAFNSQKIKEFLGKYKGNLLSFIRDSFNTILTINNFIESTPEKLNLTILSSCGKILLTITYHEELTHLFLENKEYFNLIHSLFSFIISLKEINTIYDEVFNIIIKIVNNIINNKHSLFISCIISNNLHLAIKNKFDFYINCGLINEKIFISLIDIIGSLFDSQKRDKIKTEFVKLDMDNNRFKEIIINVIKKFGNNDNINKKCNIFLDNYYPNEPKQNVLQLSNFNFLDLNL